MINRIFKLLKPFMSYSKLPLICLCIVTLILSSNGVTEAQSIQKDFHQWASTPPMGWNSWDCYGPTVTEAEVKTNADYMATHLVAYGWQYVVVDIRWYVENDKSHGYNEKDPIYTLDSYGRFMPAVNRFPSAAGNKGFKPLADYIHAKGLKFGIHIMRGVPVETVKHNLPILHSNATAKDIYSTEGQCKWLHDMYTVAADKPGAQEYYNSLFALYASWGVDFVKVDDLSAPLYQQEEVEMIRKAIDRSGRKMVLSTSPGETPIASASHVASHANMWRTIDDFWDIWKELKAHFDICNRWAPYIGNGHYPDADMLPLGRLSIRGERGDDRMTHFTKDEQYTVVTLWSIFRSPLIFGGDLPSCDAFTLSLLTNKEVLAVNQQSKNNKQLFNDNDRIAWIADDPKTGDKYLALFYAADKTAKGEAPADSVEVAVKLSQIGFSGKCLVRDLWNHKNTGTFSGEFAPYIRRHGAALYRISENKKQK